MRRITTLALTMSVLVSFAMPSHASEPAARPPEAIPGPSEARKTIVFFKSTAETGDLSEWVGDGGGHVFAFTGEDWTSVKTQAVQASTEQAHSGRYSIRCSIPDPRKGQDAKLYREGILQSAAYYSAWFWFDRNFKPTEWVNIFQWKTNGPARDRPDDFGLANYCDPTFVLNFYYRPDSKTSRLMLYHWPVGQGYLQGARAVYEQAKPRPVPHSQWVHIEGYYKVHPTDGEVIVWQDGEEIFHVTGANTRDARGEHPNNKPGTVLWGVGIYSSKGNTGSLLAYVDDMLVTDHRAGREEKHSATRDR